MLKRLSTAWPVERWRDVHVLVAVSGGADSIGLLRGLLALKGRAGGDGRLFAGHVNHQLRGEASGADEAWVREQCRLLDVPLSVQRSDAAMLAAVRGDGIEEAARVSRYRLLTTMAETVGARFVATAHTRDDQVETVLFRLLRGSGLRGLAGMPETRRMSPSVALVRPLLTCGRAEVRAYLETVGQLWRDDASNRDLRFARNRVRDQLLPFLRENFNAEVDAAIARFAELAGEASQMVEALAEELLEKCDVFGAASQPSPRGGFRLSIEPLVSQPELLACEALRLAWRRAGLAEQAMTNAQWRELARFARTAQPGRSLNLPGNVRATLPSPGVLAVGSSLLA